MYLQENKNSSVSRNKIPLGRNFSKGTVENCVQYDARKDAPGDHPHSIAKFQVNGQCVQQQIITDQL